MKISYSNYPILEKLHKGSLGNMPYFQDDKNFFDVYGNFFVDYWKLNLNYFNEDINVISKTFFEATTLIVTPSSALPFESLTTPLIV